jgi:hypothetical protein
LRNPGALSGIDRSISRWHLERLLKFRVAFPIVVSFFVALVAVRFYHLSVTGYLLPDEAYYYETVVLGQPSGYHREVFTAIYSLYFGWARGFESFFVAGLAFVLTWATGSLGAFYLLIKELDVPEKYGSLMIFSLPLVPVFTLLLTLMLTETMGLFFALLGILFTLRYVKKESAWNALLAAIFLVMAYKVREPYLLLAVANLLTIVIASPRNWKGILCYLVPLLTVLPIPVSLTPLIFAQPGYTYLLVLTRNVQQVTTHVTTQPLPNLLPQVSLETLGEGTFSIAPNLTFRVAYAFLIGFALGYNPLFALFAIIAIALGFHAILRRKIKRNDATALWNSILSIAGFAVALFVLIYPAAGLIPYWASTAIRASHTSLPAFLSFRNLYGRISPKRLTTIILLAVILSSTQIPILLTAVQSNLTRTNDTIDRINLNYRAPYFRLYQIAEHSRRTLVIVGGDSRGASMYLSWLPNVVSSGIPADESGFKSLVSGNWDTIILYDSYYTIRNPAMIALVYPQYYQFIVLGTHYESFLVEPIWIDGESYALKLVQPA